MRPNGYLLIAEDDETDVLFLKRAFAKAEIQHSLVFVTDGMEAIEYLTALKLSPDGKLPDLMLLDMKMPRRSGLQVLQWMRAQPVIRAVPVLLFSSSANTGDIENAYEAGANGFLVKPSSTAERNRVVSFIREWLTHVHTPLGAAEGFRVALRYRNTTLGRRSEVGLRTSQEMDTKPRAAVWTQTSFPGALYTDRK